MRAFGAEDGGKGANVGVFYRNIADYTKIGINSFVDYEEYSWRDRSFANADFDYILTTTIPAMTAVISLAITDKFHNNGNNYNCYDDVWNYNNHSAMTMETRDANDIYYAIT